MVTTLRLWLYCTSTTHPTIQLLELLSTLCSSPLPKPVQRSLRFVLTSRPYNNINDGLLDCPKIRLSGEEKNEEINKGIDLVTRHGVAELARRKKLNGAHKTKLEEWLLSMEHRTYYGSIARFGHKAVVDFLVQNGADVNTLGGFPALGAASRRRHLAIVELLLQNGADVDAIGGYYNTGLAAAPEKGQLALVKLLLQNGAYVNAESRYHGTALGAASKGGHLAMVELLLQNDANVNAFRRDNALRAALK